MKTRIHAKGLDPTFRLAMYGMIEYSMTKLIPSKRLRKNLEINVHMRTHAESGEAMIDEFANPKKPRSFRVILDRSKMEHNDSGEERTDAEVAIEILKTLGHELVHVKQYAMGELTTDRYGALRYNGVHYNVETLLDYFDLPYEIEAYGKEKGLLVGFLSIWKHLEDEI
tara:strand:- start:560 stop:1066 length:507 start_codon:yes stop_codon:yes gene_type:complete